MPEQVDGFSKTTDRDDELTYAHDEDETLVTAEENADGTWAVTAFIESTDGPVELARALGGRDEAMQAMVSFMERYTPVDAGSDPRASSRPQMGGGGMADEMMNDDGGDGLLARASEAGKRVASKAGDATRGALGPSEGDSDSGLGELFDESERDGESALERLSDDRDRSSPLFDDTMRGSDGPSAFETLGDDRDRSSPLFDDSDDDDDSPSAFDMLGDDRDRSSPLFDDSDDDDDTPSAFEKLSNADDSGDLYGGRR